MAIQAKLAR